MKRLGLAVILSLMLSGCAFLIGEQAPQTAPVDKCAGWTSAEFTAEDIEVISQELSDWLDSHEANGEKNGCWES